MIHSDNMAPFFGIIESIVDPEKNGRYQVRVFGYNSANRGILPTSVLKWFRTVNSNSASVSGIGRSPTGYLEGSLVFGYYLGTDRQDGIILGAVPGFSGGVNDVSPLATGEGGVNLDSKKGSVVSGVPDSRGDTWSEPSTPYAAEYPSNDVMVTKSGHVVEFDDTPGAERISIFHKSGTFEEIHPDGKKVERKVSDSFEIDLSGKYVFVNGDLNAFVNKDYRLNVGGEIYIKAGGGVTFDTELVRILGNSEATDHISSNVSGRDHIHSGVQTGPGFTAVPVGATAGFAPTAGNTFSLETEDSGFTPEVIALGLSQGFLSESDIQIIETYEPTLNQVDTTETPTEVPPVEPSDCMTAVDSSGKIDYNIILAGDITLRELSLGAVVSQYSIVDQVGLTKQQIICNLQNVAENLVVPIKKQFPNVMVTSGFRQGSGTSQHLKGEAIDIQFRNVSNSFYFQTAQWIKQNLAFDQLILEYKNFGSGLPWIHVSLTRNRKQRQQVLTFFNHKKHSDGLVDLS